MTTDLATRLVPEQELDNEWFTIQLVRQPDERLLGHIQYKKWSATAKKKTIEFMNTLNEPLFVFIHDKYHFKYVTSLGFASTGRLVTCDFPGKEGMLFPEAVYYKEDPTKLYLLACKEEKELLLPLVSVDGYGKIEAIEEKLKTIEQAKWKTVHYFSDGVYTRETTIPAGTMLTGYRHRNRTVSVLVKGIISVLGVDKQGHATDYGVLEAPKTFITESNIKKIGFAHEETVFINSFSLSGIPEELWTEGCMEQLEEYLFDKEGQSCLESL